MQFQKGDIVAVHGNGLIAYGIEAVSHSSISHVAIVADVEKGLLIEAQGGREVGYNQLSAYEGECFVLRFPNLTAEQQDGIVDYAHKQFGKKYDYVEIVHQFARYVLNAKDDNPENQRFICSTLIDQAYKSVGITLTDVPLPSPDDLFETKKVDIVGRY